MKKDKCGTNCAHVAQKSENNRQMGHKFNQTTYIVIGEAVHMGHFENYIET